MAGLNNKAGVAPSISLPGSDAGKFGGPRTNKELMADARESLSGNWGMSILGYILYFVLVNCFYLCVAAAELFVLVVTGILEQSQELAMQYMGMAFSGISILISGPLMVGFSALFLGVAQNNEVALEDLFVGFRRFFRSFGTYFLLTVFVMLWSLLFIIPGIIASFRYAMAFMVIADDPSCGPLEAIGRSKVMMRGNKWKFFCLHWRFFWWALLASVFTLGLGYLWLIPYMQTSFAAFYEDVK